MALDLPYTGNRLLSTWKLLKDPYGAYETWRSNLGDTFVIRALNGDVVVSCAPDFVADFLKLTDDDHVPFATEAGAGVLGPGTMIVARGEAHKRKRRLAGPHFRGERMRAYASMVDEVARARIAGWSGELRLMDETLPISLDVIIRAVFGADDDGEIEQYRAEITTLVERLSPMFFFTRHTQRRLWGLGPWARYRDALEQLAGHLGTRIEARRAAPAEQVAERSDILTALALARDEGGDHMPVAEVAEELIGLLFAGHETTQIALAWAIYWLHKHPETMEKLRAELDAAPPDAAARLKLPYLDAVVHETLRLHPIVPDVLRTLAVDKTLGGIALKAGQGVAVAAAMTHARADLYPEPQRFDPERFVGQKPRPQSYLPFGAGVRRCIGAGLALFEMKLVIAEIVTGVELELLGDEVPVRRNVTTAPKHGVRVRVVGRRG